MWGEDALEWNPQRFLSTSPTSSLSPSTLGAKTKEGGDIQLGMYANLMTFSAGAKGCIGWRFAVLQLQNLLAELVDRFELEEEPVEARKKVVRANCMSTQPMVEGEYARGAQLPLVVRGAA